MVDENVQTNNEESKKEPESKEEIMKSEEKESVLQETQEGSQNQEAEKKENHNKDNDDNKRSRKIGRTRTYGQHQYRMNSITFYNFYMEIWDKHQGRSRECIDELIAKLDDLGYEKISIDETWIEKNPYSPHSLRLHKQNL